jgi:(E)-4-hydroxy-3-methylbut-2-enyl-diphosphate synthase
MSRYGDTPIGMVESAMEFLRIARGESYHQVVLSMKSSNPQVMVQAYRLLVQQMDAEFGECYPLHLGVTEAGDGEDGRIKSAIGIGTLLEDGIGDTIRVSLTEDPEFEIPVCRDIVKRYEGPAAAGTGAKIQVRAGHGAIAEYRSNAEGGIALPYNPFAYRRRASQAVHNTGAQHVPVVVADHSGVSELTPQSLEPIGYSYNELTDKWAISDGAADYIYTGAQAPAFALPGTLQVICVPEVWEGADQSKCLPIYDQAEYLGSSLPIDQQHFVRIDANQVADGLLDEVKCYRNAVLVAYTTNAHAMASLRRFFAELMEQGIHTPVIIQVQSPEPSVDEQLIHYATEAGGLLLDGLGDGLWLRNTGNIVNSQISGRTYLELKSGEQFLNNTAFSILQATRTRISKTEYISCPSCGRTLFDLQETTARIRAATNHLKGVKIAIMGCIVNGPGEMADADFGYVGSGPGKITLYKGKEVVKKNVPSEVAVDELIGLLKENEVWVE